MCLLHVDPLALHAASGPLLALLRDSCASAAACAEPCFAAAAGHQGPQSHQVHRLRQHIRCPRHSRTRTTFLSHRNHTCRSRCPCPPCQTRQTQWWCHIGRRLAVCHGLSSSLPLYRHRTRRCESPQCQTTPHPPICQAVSQEAWEGRPPQYRTIAPVCLFRHLRRRTC